MRAQMSFFSIANTARSATLALAAGLLWSLSFEARAFDVSEADKEACTPDAFRLCEAYIPDSDRVGACLRANIANLSPACHAVFHAQPVAQPVPGQRRRVHRITTSYDHKHRYHRDDDGTWARD